MNDLRIFLPEDMIELQAALNAPSGSFFETVLSGIANGYGYDSNGAGVTMPGDVEQEDHIPREEVDHVECYFPGSDDTLTVSLSAFRRHLATAVEGETARHPDRAARLRELHAAADGWIAAHPLVAAGKA